MIRFPVVLPVGPGAEEEERVRDTLDSLLAHEPGAGPVLLIDDDPAGARDLSAVGEVEVLRNPRNGFGQGTLAGTCTAMLVALARLHELGSFGWALRIDTDTLVIAPFAERVERALARSSGTGLAGSFDTTANGEPRDFTVWRGAVRQLRSPLRVYRRPPAPGLRVEQALWGRAARMRRVVRDALRNGYEPGEHVLGAALVITRDFVSRMHSAGHLDDPLTWLTSPVCDDVMLGAQARALGLGMLSLSDAGGPVGAYQRGLPDTPERLLERGFGLVHSVKGDRHASEAQLREFFRRSRPARGG